VISTSWWNPLSKSSPPPAAPVSGEQSFTDAASPTLPVPGYAEGQTAAAPVASSFDISTLDSTQVEVLQDSTPALLELGDYPSHLAIKLVEQIHVTADVPYWVAIAATTLAVRVLLLPLAVKTLRNSSRMAHMKPELDIVQGRMKADPLFASDAAVQKRYKEQMNALFAKYDCNPFKSLLFPLAQMPLFISFFIGLKSMPEFLDVTTGGALWFTDLSIPDSSLALPIVTAATFLCMLEIGADGMNTMQGDQKKMMVMVFRGLGVLMVPMTMSMPQSVFMYWVTNNCISLTQAIAFKSPGLKKSLGIWEPPKVVSAAIVGLDGKPIAGTEKGGDLQQTWKEIMAKAKTKADERDEQAYGPAGTKGGEETLFDPKGGLGDKTTKPVQTRKGGKKGYKKR
jgi:YidC/Oxa1 family membrane protein insertase